MAAFSRAVARTRRESALVHAERLLPAIRSVYMSRHEFLAARDNDRPRGAGGPYTNSRLSRPPHRVRRARSDWQPQLDASEMLDAELDISQLVGSVQHPISVRRSFELSAEILLALMSVALSDSVLHPQSQSEALATSVRNATDTGEAMVFARGRMSRRTSAIGPAHRHGPAGLPAPHGTHLDGRSDPR